MKKSRRKIHALKKKNTAGRSNHQQANETERQNPITNHSQSNSDDFRNITVYPWPPTSWPEENQLPLDPKVSDERKEELSTLLMTPVNIQKGIYPFKDVKLDRNDIEWLSTNHKPQYTIVDWMGQVRREFLGIDLRGADLRGVDLRGISLANFLGGLKMDELMKATDEQVDMAGVHLEQANLNNAFLKGAFLGGAHLYHTMLQNANLENTYLDRADLRGAYLDRANLKNAGLAVAHLEGAQCLKTCLENAWLSGACLQTTDFREANLEKANLRFAKLTGADLGGANLKGAILSSANLDYTSLRGTHLEDVNLAWASLAGANLFGAHLEGTNLEEAHLEGKLVSTSELEEIRKWKIDFPATLPPADLRHVFFSAATNLQGVILGSSPSGNKDYRFVLLADANWGDVNLAVVNWKQVDRLGDDYQAQQLEERDGKRISASTRLNRFQAAVRANRQLAIALQGQGLNEEAIPFAYRAQILQCDVLKQQKNFGKYFFSRFLDILTGYGYKLSRIVKWYISLNIICTLVYFVLSGMAGIHLVCHEPFGHCSYDIFSYSFSLNYWQLFESLGSSMVASLTAFHGRGFFPEQYGQNDLRTYIAAFEAVTGLVIEASFIAAFTQRFLGK